MTDAAPYVKRLLDLSENEFCADCQKPHPTWASTTFGVFICINCSGIHRNLGTHITLVRSVTLDTWNVQQYKVMKKVGNKRANEYFEARLTGKNGRPSSTDRQSMERFIYDKYVLKLFAADGPPPHISLLMPNLDHDKDSTHRNRKIHSVRIPNPDPIIPQNKNGMQNFNKSSLFEEAGRLSNALPLSSSTHHEQSNSETDQNSANDSSNQSRQPKFARPINSNSDEQNQKKISSYDISTFNMFLNPRCKPSEVNSDNNKDKSNESDDSAFNFEKNLDITHENQKTNIQGLLSAVGIKNTVQEDNDSNQKVHNDKSLIALPRKMPSYQNSNENIWSLSTNQSNRCKALTSTKSAESSLPKFAKPLISELVTENSQKEDIKKQKTISEMKKSQRSSTKNLLEVVGISNESDSSNKGENNNSNDEIIDFAFELNEDDEIPIKTDSDGHYSGGEEQVADNLEKKKMLPKFAKKKETENGQGQDLSSESAKYNIVRHDQSNEVFKILNHIQDKNESIKPYISKSTKKEEDDNELNQEIIFYNPGVSEKASNNLESQSNQNPNTENDEQLKKHKLIPKFAKRKDESEAETREIGKETALNQNNYIFEVLNHQKNKSETIINPQSINTSNNTNLHQNISKQKDQKKEIPTNEEILFINPGIEEEDENLLNQTQDIKDNDTCEKAKPLPKFAKRKEEEIDVHNESEESLESHVFELSRHNSYSSSRNSDLFNVLNNIHEKKEPVKIPIKQKQQNIIKKTEKEADVKEELIFINPGEEEQIITEKITENDLSQVKDDNESNKSLPKFAKRKDEAESQLESTNIKCDNNPVFSILNKMDKINEELVHLKDIQKTSISKKPDKNKDEELVEDIIFINPGVDIVDPIIQLDSNINNNENKENNNYEEYNNTDESSKIKTLPKFAKRKEENEIDNDIQEINNKVIPNQNDHNVLLFEVLNHLK